MPIGRTLSIIAWLLIAIMTMAPFAQARDQVPGTGSAIAPVFSIEHSSMQPGEAVVLVACVTNRNASSHRQVEPGDVLSFEGAGLALADCEMAPVESRGAGFATGDWTCSVDGSALRLTYTGLRRTWPAGELACARMHALAPTASATLLPAVETGNFGGWAPAEPPVLFLTVDAEMGSVGPAGPAGPAGLPGPAGPQGSSGMGARDIATSTSAVVAFECDPAVLVPGLDLSLDVAGGSRVVAHVDAITHPDCLAFRQENNYRGTLLLELDGSIVVRHRVTDGGFAAANESSPEHPTALSWLSGSLAGGPHRLRVLYEYRDPQPPCIRRTSCIGGVPGSNVEAHLVAFELRAP